MARDEVQITLTMQRLCELRSQSSSMPQWLKDACDRAYAAYFGITPLAVLSPLNDYEKSIASTHKITAIKNYRERTGTPLKDCLAVVNEYLGLPVCS